MRRSRTRVWLEEVPAPLCVGKDDARSASLLPVVPSSTSTRVQSIDTPVGLLHRPIESFPAVGYSVGQYMYLDFECPPFPCVLGRPRRVGRGSGGLDRECWFTWQGPRPRTTHPRGFNA